MHCIRRIVDQSASFADSFPHRHVMRHQPADDVEHRASQHLGHVMLALVVLHSFILQFVQRASQVGLVADIVAELLGKAGERIVAVEVAAGSLGDLRPENVVAEGDQDRGEIADELVEGRGLGED